MADAIALDERVLLELKEQTKWLRFLGLRALAPLLEASLKDARERLAYELSDGSRSTRTIADAVGVSAKTISNWWQRWAAVGIATADNSGRTAHLSSLRAVGIDVPTKGPTTRDGGQNE